MKRPSGKGSKRPKKATTSKKVINVTINKKTIHNHFAPQPGPAPPPGAGPAKPPSLFSGTEVRIMAPDSSTRKRNAYIRVQSMCSGELKGECAICMKPPRAIADFAPTDHVNSRRKRADFLKANADYAVAHEASDIESAREARGRVDKFRRGQCSSCAPDPGELTPAQQECKNFWDEIRQAKCELYGGCQKAGCPMRGDNRDWRVLQGDHIDPKGLLDPAMKKVEALSKIKWWSGNGGVPAMRLEVPKLQWICGFCHNLEPTSNTGRRCGDPADMPDGKSSGTDEEIAQYKIKHHAKITFPKQQYVDAEKLLRRKRCARCERAVTPATCVAFQFDHRDETTKMKSKKTLAGKNGGVCGLVNNCANAAALDVVYDAQGKIQYDDHGVICVRDNEFKPVLDHEMKLCRLLCANCHKLKTSDGEKVGDEEEYDEA